MAVIEERKCPDGTLKYRVRIRIKGRPAESETFDRRADAKEWANKREYELKQEIRMGLSHAAKKTIGMMIDRYMELELPKKRSNQDATRVALLWWRDQIGERTLAELTPSLLSECRDRLLNEPYTPCKYGPADWKERKKGPATVVRYMASMSHVLTIACNEWQWLAVNAMTKVKRPTLPRGRVRFLSDEERGRLLEAYRQSHWEDLYTLVILALSTGARKSELLGLRWKDIDLNLSVARLEKTKNNERRALPLAHHARDLILSMKEKRQPRERDYVFPSQDGTAPRQIKRPWEAAVELAELEDFRFHDLRHSAASYLAMNGASLAEIAEVLGHKTLQMVKRYAHLSDQHVAGVVERMNKAIFTEPANDNNEPVQLKAHRRKKS